MARADNTERYNLDDAQRWRSYRNGILDHPAVRKAELTATLDLLNPQPDERILEIGAGSGYLSFPIAAQLGQNGHLTTADINKEGLAQLKQNAQDLPLDTFYFSDQLYKINKFEALYGSDLDAVCTLAAFHHFDNRVDKSGDYGRRAFVKETLKLLKPGGRLIIVDVGGKTPTQEYFDAIDDPHYFAPAGHPHNFQTPEELTQMALDVGFESASAEIREMPWVFDTLEQAQGFIHTIHNAQCSTLESFDIAEKVLGVEQKNGRFELNWQLMFFSAVKGREQDQ